MPAVHPSLSAATGLEEEQEHGIVDAMFEKTVVADELVIRSAAEAAACSLQNCADMWSALPQMCPERHVCIGT
jgi:hypothetical protein